MLFTFFEDCINGEVRIIGISNPLKGRVEVCLDGIWGRVCSREWGRADAAVVCRQLGYSSSGAFSFSLALIVYC